MQPHVYFFGGGGGGGGSGGREHCSELELHQAIQLQSLSQK